MFGNNKIEKKQKTEVTEIQILDDVFHRTIISLERLEMRLEGVDNQKTFVQTAMGGSRDLHDPSVVLNLEAYYDELALDCNALYKAARFDDEELFKSAATVFVKDILMWYAGREGMSYNEVDAAIVPILVAVTRQVNSTSQVDKIFDEYVHKPEELDLSLEGKYEGVKDMVESWIKANHMLNEGTISGSHSDESGSFTSHKRGSVEDGFKRVFSFLTSHFNTTFPAKLFIRSVKDFVPDLAAAFDGVNEDLIETMFAAKDKENSKKGAKEYETVNASISTGVPFEVVNNADSNIESSKVTLTEIYPQLVDTVKKKLDGCGVKYNDIEIIIK